MGKKNKSGLGRALVKDRFSNKPRNHESSMLHTSEINDGYDWGRLNLQSVTEQSSFQEFLSTAELAGTEFQAEKLNITFVNPKANVGVLSQEEKIKFEIDKEEMKHRLRVPRRPKWNAETTPEELQTKERESFLEWRRGLAILQEGTGYVLTPYEKNLDFWRQLWRVVERSDVVIQILDARNPLLFRSEDLESYVLEVDPRKRNMFLINKSDFLTVEQRKYWYSFFKSNKLDAIFFSALEATETTETTIEKLKIESNPWDVLGREELIDLFENLSVEHHVTPGLTTIGLVGYPNVGKSSTINALMADKKVSVSATPGKTKHFQTLYLTEKVLLCDCPGLVFPSLLSTKADMILNGILPVDQMRDHVPPICLLASLIPRNVIEHQYSVMIPKPLPGEDENRPPTPEEFLNAYAFSRGFMTQRGQPDNPRAARYVLKDFVQGRLLYCVAPPGTPQEDYHIFKVSDKKVPLPTHQATRMTRLTNINNEDVDKSFFSKQSQSVHNKGIQKINPNNIQNNKEQSGKAKPWKDHSEKRNKKEKLRRVYRHLDE